MSPLGGRQHHRNHREAAAAAAHWPSSGGSSGQRSARGAAPDASDGTRRGYRQAGSGDTSDSWVAGPWQGPKKGSAQRREVNPLGQGWSTESAGSRSIRYRLCSESRALKSVQGAKQDFETVNHQRITRDQSTGWARSQKKNRNRGDKGALRRTGLE